MTHTQPVFRNDKFKDRSSDDTFHYRVFPGYTCFLEWNCFQDLSSDVLPFPSAAAIHLSPYFSPRTREIYGWPCYEAGSHGSSPFKTWIQRYVARPLTRFPPLFHSSTIYTEFSFADGNETFEWHLLFVRFEQTKIPLESFLSNHFLWNRVKSCLYNQLDLSYDGTFFGSFHFDGVRLWIENRRKYSRNWMYSPFFFYNFFTTVSEIINASLV